MKALMAILAAFVVLTGASVAAGPDYAGMPTGELIDALASIDEPTPGAAGFGVYDVFMADNRGVQFKGGVLGVPIPTVPSQMQELVRRGLRSLPLLIRHLDDQRPTMVEIGDDFFMWQEFNEEYDPRTCDVACLESRRRLAMAEHDPHSRPFDGAYVVKVGDLCYVLIGQIVDRRLTAVRYQASGGLIVNSPVEAPALIDKVKGDWEGLTEQDHEASLLADVRTRPRYGSALARLRFYYPAAYARLEGDDLDKRKAFEADEAHAK